MDEATRRQRFRALHRPGEPLLLPNPWDLGSARIFAAQGFRALATTSSGFAATLGRRDGGVSREEALEQAASIAAATDLPVTADLEQGFADAPAGVAETLRLAAGSALAGCSIEDYAGESGGLYPRELATERVAAAAEAAHAGPDPLVLTARAENHLRGHPDLADTIARLQAFQEAGADVLYAPGLSLPGDIARVVAAVDCPLNVLLTPGGPTVGELASLGVARVSVGGNLHLVALGAVANAARELLESGRHDFWDVAAVGRKLRFSVFD